MFSGGLKRTLRKPLKTVLFLLLIAVTVTFLSIGIFLFSSTSESLEEIEAIYRTIGTVEQINRETVSTKKYDRVFEKYTVSISQSYESPIDLEILNFDGANYIQSPENRPFYYATTDVMPLYSGMSRYSEQSVVKIKIIEEYDWTIIKKAVVTQQYAGDGYPVGTQIYIYQRMLDSEDEEPFQWEIGKEYITIPDVNPQRTTEIQFTSYWNDQIFGGSHPEVLAYGPNIYLSSAQIDKYGSLMDKNSYKSVENLGLIEVSEDLYETELGRRLENMIRGGAASTEKISVLGTNSLTLLMDFYKNEAYFVAGRAITQEEFDKGSPVCIIQEEMAEGNKLEVGDTIPLSYLQSVYGRSRGAGDESWSDQYTTAIDAKGNIFKPFFKENYEIVGIYTRLSGNRWTPDYYATGYGIIIVPSKSIRASDEYCMNGDLNLKPYNVSFEIPNGTSGEYLEKIKELGLDKNLAFSFYDGGYDNIKQGIDNMREMAAILLVSGGITSLAALFFFTFIFISKEKKSIAVERSLGLPKLRSAASMMLGVLSVVFIGSLAGVAAGTAASQVVYDSVQELSESRSVDTAFSNWANIFEEGDEGITEELSGVKEEKRVNNNIIISIVIFLSVILTEIIIAGLFIINNLKQEPIKLLSSQ